MRVTQMFLVRVGGVWWGKKFGARGSLHVRLGFAILGLGSVPTIVDTCCATAVYVY